MYNDWLMISEGPGPVVATAIHDGHALRPDVSELIALSESQRLREEDPFTASWASIFDVRLISTRSRFEVDLNRPRGKAVYIKARDAWGLNLWNTQPAEKMIAESLTLYDQFYSELHRILAKIEKVHGRFVVLDLHSYNHRRGGPLAMPENPVGNPEVNVGTGSMDRNLWGSLVDQFMYDLTNFNFFVKPLDVRENIRFQGGHLSKWVHENFPKSGCCLAVEFKKFFMDEWTGEPFDHELKSITEALEGTLPGLQRSLIEVGES